MKKLLLVMMMLCLAGIGVGQVSVSAKDYNETASKLLLSAVKNDDLEQVKQAFVMGADPNYLQSRSDAPFNRAIRNDYFAVRRPAVRNWIPLVHDNDTTR